MNFLVFNTYMKNIQISAIFLTLFFLIGCEPAGPSEQEIRLEKEAAVLSIWNDALDEYKKEESGVLDGVTEFYMTDDGRGIILRTSEYEMMNMIGFRILSMSLKIPDYIEEQIFNTAPIDGNQKAKYENVEINWSIDRSSQSFSDTVSVFVSLRLID
jgi:hypothetical protein